MIKTDFTARAYNGDQDLSAMRALIRARPAAYVLDFPSLYDLHELMGTASHRDNTRLWFGSEGHLLGFAIVDLSFNTLWTELSTTIREELLLSEMI